MSKSKKTYYAIEAGGEKHIFATWPECKKFRDAHPSKARYKGFRTLEEATAFLDPSGGAGQGTSNDNPLAIADSAMRGRTAVAYSDGSFNTATGTWGYGALLFPINDPEDLLYYTGSGKDGASSRNVTGEIHGAVRAIQEAIVLGYKNVVVRYDYAGIEMWATGRWKANLPVTIWYQSKIQKLGKKIRIFFEKVDAHTGEKYNELVDGIAKHAAGIS